MDKKHLYSYSIMNLDLGHIDEICNDIREQVESGVCDMAGFGRMAFANPDFPNQLRQNGKLDKTCITCGNCAVLLRAGRCAGCVIHDREVYKL